MSLADDDWGEFDQPGHAGETGPWPAFVDLFAATALILLVFFVVIAARYVEEQGVAVRMGQLLNALDSVQQRSPHGGFTVQEQKPDVLIILEEKVTFRTNEWTLLEPAKETLGRVHGIIHSKQFGGLIREIEIVGHADRRGSPALNWQLSTNRAMTVARYFIETLHDDPCIIVPSGRGAFFPRNPTILPDTLAPAKRDSVYASDRRIEVLLHPTVGNARAAGRAGCLTP